VGWLLGKGMKMKLVMGTDNVFMGCVTIGSRLFLLSIHRESMIVPIQDFVLSMLKINLFKILFHELLIAKIFHFIFKILFHGSTYIRLVLRFNDREIMKIIRFALVIGISKENLCQMREHS